VFPSSYPLARPILLALQAEAKHRLESGRFQKVAKLSKNKDAEWESNPNLDLSKTGFEPVLKELPLPPLASAS
jgi:hypothetical protein